MAMRCAVILLAAIAGLFAVAEPAAAQLSTTPQSSRTASWYANNPGALSAVLGACRNDPGHGWNHPDCMNASQANVILAQREARRHVDQTPPTDPSYWRARPDQLRMQALTCSRIEPQYQAGNFCPAVRTASGH